MTALATAIDATQRSFTVDTALGPTEPTVGRVFRVDGELIALQGTSRARTGTGPKTTWLVERGIHGTEAASHLSGATLTEQTDPYASTGGGGVNVNDEPVTNIVAPGAVVADGEATLPASGEQTIRLLGPYRATWETPGIADVGGNPAEIAEDVVPSGAIILHAWATGVARWITPTSDARVIVSVGPAVEVSGVYYAPDASETPGASPANLRSYPHDVTDESFARIVTTQAVSSVWARVVDLEDESAPIEGEMDVYVLIAVPA